MDSDHVHLLKPLNEGFEWNELAKEAGVVVIDFCLANANQLDQLIVSFQRDYLSCVKHKPTVLMSETATNEFTRHPAIQDPNLLVAISRYADESEYQLQSQQCLDSERRTREFVAYESKVILHPTAKACRTSN